MTMLDWSQIKDAPRDGTKIDVWINIYPSARSMGFSDQFREPNIWFEDGKWVHLHRGEIKEIHSDIITHWVPAGAEAPENPDVRPTMTAADLGLPETLA